MGSLEECDKTILEIVSPTDDFKVTKWDYPMGFTRLLHQFQCLALSEF